MVQTFLKKLVKACPALPYITLGLWLAWAYIAHSGIAWLSNNETNGENISTLYIVSTLAFGIVFASAAFFVPQIRRMLANPACIIAGGAVASFGCLVIIVIGPYYLKGILSDDAIGVLFLSGCAMTGIGTAVFAMKCGELYGRLLPRKAILYAALSHLLVAAIYFVVIGAPVWQPVPGGPAFMGILAFVGTPLVAGVVATLSFVNPSSEIPVYEESRTRFPRSFWKLVVVTFVFSMTVVALRSALVELSPVDVTFESSSNVMLLRMVMALVFAGAAIAIDGEHFNIGKVYSVIMASVVVLIALCTIVGIMHVVWSQVITFMSFVYDFVLWCILAFIVYQKHISPILVFGFGYGAYMVGSGVGWFVGISALPAIMTSPNSFALYLALMAIVLGCSFILFSEKELDRLFEPSGVGEASLDLLLGNAYPETGERGETLVKRGRFVAAIDELSVRGRLSNREIDVLRCLAMGYESAATAKKLQVSWNTVRTHTRNVYAKLDVHSRQELIELVDEVAKQMS